MVSSFFLTFVKSIKHETVQTFNEYNNYNLKICETLIFLVSNALNMTLNKIFV